MQRLFQTTTGEPVSAVTTEEGRQLLQSVEKSGSVGVAELVENGSRCAYDLVVQELHGDRERAVHILAGSGFTGAVASGMARHLLNHGYAARILFPFSPERNVARHQRIILEYAGAPLCTHLDDFTGEPALVVDALVAREDMTFQDAAFVEYLNYIREAQNRGAAVLSLEMPTGVDPVTGVPSAHAVRADVTLCMAFPRTGLTHQWCGCLMVGDLGIPPEMYRRYALVTYPCRFTGDSFLLPVWEMTATPAAAIPSGPTGCREQTAETPPPE